MTLKFNRSGTHILVSPSHNVERTLNLPQLIHREPIARRNAVVHAWKKPPLWLSSRCLSPHCTDLCQPLILSAPSHATWFNIKLMLIQIQKLA